MQSEPTAVATIHRIDILGFNMGVTTEGTSIHLPHTTQDRYGYQDIPSAPPQVRTPVQTADPIALLPLPRTEGDPSAEAIYALEALGRMAGLNDHVVPYSVEDGVLTEESLATLSSGLANAQCLLLGQEEQEAEQFLRDARVRALLDRFLREEGLILGVGSACRPLARFGYLPAALTAPWPRLEPVHCVTTLAPTDQAVQVPWTANLPSLSDRRHRYVRLIRGALFDGSAPQNDSDAADPLLPTLTLRLEDRELPDGFFGRGGQVLGLLNGCPLCVLEPAMAYLTSQYSE